MVRMYGMYAGIEDTPESVYTHCLVLSCANPNDTRCYFNVRSKADMNDVCSRLTGENLITC